MIRRLPAPAAPFDTIAQIVTVYFSKVCEMGLFYVAGRLTWPTDAKRLVPVKGFVG
jgi:hypothetical protein